MNKENIPAVAFWVARNGHIPHKQVVIFGHWSNGLRNQENTAIIQHFTAQSNQYFYSHLTPEPPWKRFTVQHLWSFISIWLSQ